ncbi:MAG: tRNA guanosine(15) transglycosylase TgtA [Candidatus Caldarchaeum sp.]|nr:tRNA guanosine(15) transglycosylase TgtA [Candidatus Caldarchaeum sp.]
MDALFEVRHKDLLGRVGRLTVGNKTVETPAFVPVINPLSQVITPTEMKQAFRCNIVITNAYVLYRRLREMAVEKGVHGVIGFDDVVMTDSGGYQVLQYGGVDASPSEIALFQERIGSDIAVPLDKPTGLVGRSKAERTVDETLENVRTTLEVLGPSPRCVWVAPIQGGVYSDLVERCVEEYKKMGFSLYCLGSPTPLMTSYRYRQLAEMVAAARLSLGAGEVLHLFGAGHPMIFSLAVALGCDLFDSASYALFALEDRYLVSDGTVRLEQLSTLPCSCRACQSTTIEELKEMAKEERFKHLAWHNLSVCFQEVNLVKQAVWEGRLFELLEKRARSHPALYEAFRYVFSDERLLDAMVRQTPVSKRRGIFLFDSFSLRRPDVWRAANRLRSYSPKTDGCSVAVLVNYRLATTKNHTQLLEKIAEVVGEEDFEVYTYGTPYGLVPFSLVNVHPFSQTTFPQSLMRETENEVFQNIADTLKQQSFTKVLVVLWGRDVYPGFSEGLTAYIRMRLGVEALKVRL